MKLFILGHDFAYEMECVLRLFFPGEKIEILRENNANADNAVITQLNKEDGRTEILVSVAVGSFASVKSMDIIHADEDKNTERLMAVLMFAQLCEYTGMRPPWGILTGVRPVRFCRSLIEEGKTKAEAAEILVRDYLVLPQKAGFALETYKNEEKILAMNSERFFSLYISIPFCPSRCSYCSFVSQDIQKGMKLIPDYVGLLCEEIKYTAQTVQECGLMLQTVYIGGGTPTTLEAESLEIIMQAVKESFDFSGLIEYTVEAGRPDTITAEKLSTIKTMGATRISVNPQTMNDAVLAQIGRKHSAQQSVEAFMLARQIGFDCINMDLIAGLPGDSNKSFENTIDKVLELAPENITIHTLTVKRSSNLREDSGAYDEPDMDIADALNLAGERLTAAKYMPYYMYRQKGTKGNLENTGYTLAGSEGIYNVYVMEELHTVLAVGAGAVTKLCLHGDIKRIYNYKYPYEYINGFDEMLRRKSETKNWFAKKY